MKEKDLITALQTLSRYLGHDMKGPLRAIRFYSESGGEESAEELTKDYFTKINSSGGKLDLLLKQGHIELRALLWKLEPIETDLVRMVSDICEGFGLDPVFISAPPKILTNYSLAFELFEIILKNSRTWAEGDNRIDIDHNIQNDLLNIFIRDRGTGLSEKGNPEKMYFPGMVLDPDDPRSGHGYGLYFAQLIMQKIGGAIEVSNNKNETGILVVLSFPI